MQTLAAVPPLEELLYPPGGPGPAYGPDHPDWHHALGSEAEGRSDGTLRHRARAIYNNCIIHIIV